MKKLNPLKGSYIKYLQDVIDDKYEPGKSRLSFLKPSLSLKYFNYQRNYLLDTLEAVTQYNYNTQDHSDLENCYLNSTASLGEMVKNIRLNQEKDLQGTCQYCGIQKPNTIDHYLPKSDFPEFSILALNLLPCCGDCNSKKHNYWLDQGNRGIINFYIDNLPQIQFLFCDITFENGHGIPNVTFNLNIPTSVDARLSQIIINHFTRLELCDRYLDYTHDFITNKIDSIVSYLNSDDVNEIGDRIQKESVNLERRYGINNWRTVLTNEMSSNVEFIELIRSKI